MARVRARVRVLVRVRIRLKARVRARAIVRVGSDLCLGLASEVWSALVSVRVILMLGLRVSVKKGESDCQY